MQAMGTSEEHAPRPFSAARRREPAFVWVTWLTKILAGKDSCLWAAWFKSNFTDYAKTPDDFDSVSWNLKHTAALNAVEASYRQRYETVTRENQNSFRLAGSSGRGVLSGKPDLVAMSSEEIRIVDVKTSKHPRDEEWIQVAIYMLAWRLCFAESCKDRRLVGELVYNDARQEIYDDEITTEFAEMVFGLLRKITGETPPPPTPSSTECGYCRITRADCHEKAETEAVARSSGFGDF
jgi:CRISPR/Cas system-associated exonuclease Cas4 (RecB family)